MLFPVEFRDFEKLLFGYFELNDDIEIKLLVKNINIYSKLSKINKKCNEKIINEIIPQFYNYHKKHCSKTMLVIDVLQCAAKTYNIILFRYLEFYFYKNIYISTASIFIHICEIDPQYYNDVAYFNKMKNMMNYIYNRIKHKSYFYGACGNNIFFMLINKKISIFVLENILDKNEILENYTMNCIMVNIRCFRNNNIEIMRYILDIYYIDPVIKNIFLNDSDYIYKNDLIDIFRLIYEKYRNDIKVNELLDKLPANSHNILNFLLNSS